MKKLRAHLTYANVMATIAVFLVLGGGAAVAAGGLGKNTVGSKQLKKNSIGTLKLKDGAVSGAKLQDGAVTGAKVQAGSLPASALAPGAKGLGSTVVVIKQITANLTPNTTATGSVQCPAGFQALSGGVDANNSKQTKVSSTGPTFNGVQARNTPDGQTGPANGWEGSATSQGADAGTSQIKVYAVCAPIG
jgi:hypothetical protein